MGAPIARADRIDIDLLAPTSIRYANHRTSFFGQKR